MTYPALRTTNRTALFLDGISRDTPDWAGAACVGHDPDLWDHGDEDSNDYDQAFAICEECPIWRTCLDYSLTTRQRHLMWGGYAPRDRFRLIGEALPDASSGGPPKRAPTHGTESAYWRHKRWREAPCDGCEDAHKEFLRKRRERGANKRRRQ
jgi:hypothetical protein